MCQWGESNRAVLSGGACGREGWSAGSRRMSAWRKWRVLLFCGFTLLLLLLLLLRWMRARLRRARRSARREISTPRIWVHVLDRSRANSCSNSSAIHPLPVHKSSTRNSPGKCLALLRSKLTRWVMEAAVSALPITTSIGYFVNRSIYTTPYLGLPCTPSWPPNEYQNSATKTRKKKRAKMPKEPTVESAHQANTSAPARQSTRSPAHIAAAAPMRVSGRDGAATRIWRRGAGAHGVVARWRRRRRRVAGASGARCAR